METDYEIYLENSLKEKMSTVYVNSDVDTKEVLMKRLRRFGAYKSYVLLVGKKEVEEYIDMIIDGAGYFE